MKTLKLYAVQSTMAGVEGEETPSYYATKRDAIHEYEQRESWGLGEDTGDQWNAWVYPVTVTLPDTWTPATVAGFLNGATVTHGDTLRSMRCQSCDEEPTDDNPKATGTLCRDCRDAERDRPYTHCRDCGGPFKVRSKTPGARCRACAEATARRVATWVGEGGATP